MDDDLVAVGFDLVAAGDDQPAANLRGVVGLVLDEDEGRRIDGYSRGLDELGVGDEAAGFVVDVEVVDDDVNPADEREPEEVEIDLRADLDVGGAGAGERGVVAADGDREVSRVLVL